mmetsp:Transcript_1878/g.1327  ORF Transcript_1878/g.1327 Transcript_1878/m.1327 type:complete len:169 (+) Transcript_1878:444-950(+)
MPLFGLKLLSVIVERNQGFVAIIKKLNLVPILLDYFSVGQEKFNSFTVKIVKQVVASREVELEELLQCGIIEKANAIMASVTQNNQEWCTDVLLEIMNEILHQAAELKKKAPNNNLPQDVYNSLLVNFKGFIKLLVASDVSIVEKASQNILAFIHFSMIQSIQKHPEL